mgnify:CR=1 FL=1
MTVKEAIKWLDREQREFQINELENTRGLDAADIAISKIEEACRIACSVMKGYVEHGLD